MRQFTCDNCGDVFPQDIEVVKHKDEHGVWHTYDFCAPCNNILNKEKEGRTFLKKVKKGKK
jgi:hypothetical protein